jgi:hypothetical protein
MTRPRLRDLAPPLLALSLLAAPLAAQEPPPPTGEEPPPAEGAAPEEPSPEPEAPRFRLGGEIKVHFRDSQAQESLDQFPFPPSFRPGNNPDIPIFLRTVSAHPSFEISTATLRGEGEISSHVSAKVEVHFLDLYNRNPTSSDDRIFVREAWVAFGRRDLPLQPIGGSATLYVQAGMAPRFTKQQQRRLESYGLWGTAVGRFEQPQVQAGGTFARHVYWRAMAGNGNPLFLRDPNALAGDNGTPERQPGNVNPIYESGFPIMYDAKPQDLNPSGRFEWGAGLGVRAAGESRGFDLLGWYFTRKLEPVVRIRGTSYSGDIKMLRGVFFPLPFSGDEKREAGVNLEGRLAGGRLFAQYVDQDIAELPRRGYEVELAWRFALPGLFLVGESPVVNWIQPVVRVSHIDNRFTTPRQFPAPSFGWDWTKYDFGLRVGLVREVDLTAEYARHDAVRANGTKIHPDELLITLRAGF